MWIFKQNSALIKKHQRIFNKCMVDLLGDSLDKTIISARKLLEAKQMKNKTSNPKKAAPKIDQDKDAINI